jgi:hypothetical protein
VRGRWSLLALVAAVVVCAGLAQTSPGHAVLRDVGLYEVPASYTELAFTDAGALPDTLEPVKGPVPVSFSLHNVSASPQTYQWSIALTHDGKSKVKATGTVGVPAQGKATVTKSVTPCGTGPEVQVVVRLASPAESINFWVLCPASTATPQPTGGT